MIAKQVPMRSIGKSDFSSLASYITDAQSKDHRLGHVSITNCDSGSLAAAIEEVLATQHLNTRTKSDKTYHLIVSFRAGENPDAEILKAIVIQSHSNPGCRRNGTPERSNPSAERGVEGNQILVFESMSPGMVPRATTD